MEGHLKEWKAAPCGLNEIVILLKTKPLRLVFLVCLESANEMFSAL